MHIMVVCVSVFCDRTHQLHWADRELGTATSHKKGSQPGGWSYPIVGSSISKL